MLCYIFELNYHIFSVPSYSCSSRGHHRGHSSQSVLGERGRRIKKLTSVVQKRVGSDDGTVEVCFSLLSYISFLSSSLSVVRNSPFQLYTEKVSNLGLCAVAQCKSLRYKLVGGLAVRRACYGVLRSITGSGT